MVFDLELPAAGLAGATLIQINLLPDLLLPLHTVELLVLDICRDYSN